MQSWLNKQKPFKRVLIVFLMFFVLWLVVDIFLKPILFDEEIKPWKHIIISCAFMAIGFTVSFDWKGTKDLFKKQVEEKH